MIYGRYLTGHTISYHQAELYRVNTSILDKKASCLRPGEKVVSHFHKILNCSDLQKLTKKPVFPKYRDFPNLPSSMVI